MALSMGISLMGWGLIRAMGGPVKWVAGRPCTNIARYKVMPQVMMMGMARGLLLALM